MYCAYCVDIVAKHVTVCSIFNDIVAKHMTAGVLFLVRFNNFDQTTDFYWSYTLLLKPPVLMRFCFKDNICSFIFTSLLGTCQSLYIGGSGICKGRGRWKRQCLHNNLPFLSLQQRGRKEKYNIGKSHNQLISPPFLCPSPLPPFSPSPSLLSLTHHTSHHSVLSPFSVSPFSLSLSLPLFLPPSLSLSLPLFLPPSLPT